MIVMEEDLGGLPNPICMIRIQGCTHGRTILTITSQIEYYLKCTGTGIVQMNLKNNLHSYNLQTIALLSRYFKICHTITNL